MPILRRYCTRSLVSAAIYSAVVGLGGLVAHTACAATSGPEQLPTTKSESNTLSYSPDFFQQYQPSNALDMITNIPGFSFSGGNNNTRGYSGSVGNVLIDGQRPASKSGLDNTISNINFDQVARIDLISGGAEGIDMGGHRMVVNIIRKPDAKPSVVLTAVARHYGDIGTKGVLGVSYSQSRNNVSTDFSVAFFSFLDEGVNDSKRDRKYANGATEHLDIFQEAGGTGIESQFSHSRPLLGGTISLTATYNPIDYDQDSDYRGTSLATEHFDFKEIQSETGLQYERKLNDSLSSDVNYLRRHNRTTIFDQFIDGADISNYTSLMLSNEHILSGKLTWKKSSTLSFTLGSESVYNGRDETSLYTVNDTDQDISASTVLVEEDRSESFVTMNWEANKKLNVETEIRLETSTISVAESNRSDSFVYFKPRVQLIYTLDEKSKFTWLVKRRVEQLSFDDFATKIELQNENITLGNGKLVPQKAWVTSFIYERKFWDTGALTLKFEHQAFEDTYDKIAIIDGANVYSANGNLGRGRRDLLSLDSNIPLDKLGIKDATLNIDLQLRDSNVYDPIIARDRHISRIEPYKYGFEFTQNFTRLSSKWGINLQAMDSEEIFRANEHIHYHYAPFFQIWGEYKTKSNLTYIIRLNNPFGLHYDYDRTVYNGLREGSTIAYTEHQSGVMPTMLMLKLKKDL